MGENMEQIIYLEADDNIQVIRDRLRRAQAHDVILVVPAAGKVLRRPLDLRLLRRQGAALKLGLALVSGDPGLRDMAIQEGLVVFSTLAAARLAARRGGLWEARDLPGMEGLIARLRRQRRGQWWYWVLGPLVMLLVLAVLLWSVIMVWPSATVGVVQAREPIGVSLWVTASMGTQTVNWERMQMPARVVQVEVVERGTIDTTGVANIAAGKASGIVLFVNSTQHQVTIPVDTIVSTTAGTPIRFRTVNSAVVEPRGRIRVTVEALEPGPGGNVSANRINRVEGGLAASLNVTNEGGTGGGSTSQVRRVTHGDKQALRDLLVEMLVVKAHAEIAAVLEAEFLPLETMQVNPYSIRENYDHHVEDQADTLTLEMRGVVWGLAVSQETASEIARRELMSQVRGGFHLLPETIRLARGNEVIVDPEIGDVHFVMEGVALMEADLDVHLIQEAIRGRPLPEALAYLNETLPVETAPTLRIDPPWMTRVPWMPFRISVVQEQDVDGLVRVLPGS